MLTPFLRQSHRRKIFSAGFFEFWVIASTFERIEIAMFYIIVLSSSCCTSSVKRSLKTF
jgi:hypothetical protein